MNEYSEDFKDIAFLRPYNYGYRLILRMLQDEINGIDWTSHDTFPAFFITLATRYYNCKSFYVLPKNDEYSFTIIFHDYFDFIDIPLPYKMSIDDYITGRSCNATEDIFNTIRIYNKFLSDMTSSDIRTIL